MIWRMLSKLLSFVQEKWASEVDDGWQPFGNAIPEGIKPLDKKDKKDKKKVVIPHARPKRKLYKM